MLVVDTNLLLLLVVGLADVRFNAAHKRLRDDFTGDDLALLRDVIAEFSELVLLPHVMAEVSSWSRYIADPARSLVQQMLRNLVENSREFYVPSASAAGDDDFLVLGLTDAVILRFCAGAEGPRRSLLTADQPLARRALALGHSVINYREL